LCVKYCKSFLPEFFLKSSINHQSPSRKIQKSSLSKVYKFPNVINIMAKEKDVGEISNYFEHVQVAAIKVKTPLKIGDSLRFVGGETNFEQKIDSMQINHKKVASAKKGDEVGIKISQRVRKGYKVFKV